MLHSSGKESKAFGDFERAAASDAQADKLKIDAHSINLFLQAPVAIAILEGPEFRVRLANDPILELWGKGKNIIGLPILEVLPEMAGQGYYELLRNVLLSGETFKANESKVRLVRNGVEEVLYFNFINQQYSSLDGSVSGVLVIALDVTETVVSRKKIEESETRLRNIIEQSPSPILILKGEELVLEVANQPLFDLWGTGPEAIGKPFLQILPEMKDQVFEQLLKGVLKTGEPYYGYETPAYFIRSTGIEETVYVNFIYQPYRQSDGVITGVIVLATDVTEQVKAKQELIQSEARNRLAVEAAQLGTYEIDLTTQKIIHNPRVATIFGFPVSEHVPYLVFADAVHPDDKEIRIRAHETANKTGELLYEVRILKPDQTICWIKLNGKIIFDKGISSILIGTVLDITEEKKAAEILEQRIEERTKELLQSNAQLEKTNTELEQFTHITGHDLQEPLRKITLYSNMVLSQGSQQLEDGIKKNLAKIKDTAERMSASLAALLNYTQLKKVEAFVDIDLNPILEGIISDLELLIADKKGKVVYEKLPVIKGIPHQIQQLFYNLLNNALKFSKANVAPVITIRVTQSVGSAIDIHLNSVLKYWHFIIEDNGIGFDQKFSDRIFMIFQRLHTKQTYSGTGIGLTLCKKVIENHHGLIWATSEVNKGTQFHFVIPA